MDDFKIVMGRMKSVYESYISETMRLPIDTDVKAVQKALKGSFHGSVLEGFNIYSLVNQLAAMLEDTEKKILPFKIENYYKFFQINTGNIEARVEGDLMRLYFPIQPKCNFLSPGTKTKFLAECPRENNSMKIEGLLAQKDNFFDEMAN